MTECMPASVLSDRWGVSRGACLHVHLGRMHGSNTHHPPAMTVMRVCPGSPWFGNVQLSNTTPSTSCLCPLINTGPTHDMAIDVRQNLQSAMAMDVLLGPTIHSTLPTTMTTATTTTQSLKPPLPCCYQPQSSGLSTQNPLKSLGSRHVDTRN